MSVDMRLQELGLSIPGAIRPAFNYATVAISDNVAYVSGQLPKTGDAHELLHYGKVGTDVTLEEAHACARLCALHGLSVLREALGEGALDRIDRILSVTGYVASSAEFYEQPKVVDGASELLTQIFGEAGRHSRAAIGVAALPRNAPVEVSMVVHLAATAPGGA